jgi:hypothetical protein
MMGHNGGLKDEYHVLPGKEYDFGPNKGWLNVSEEGVETRHKIKKHAVKKAKELAKKAAGEVVIHDQKGKEQKRLSYNGELKRMHRQDLPGEPRLDNEVSGSFDEFYGL